MKSKITKKTKIDYNKEFVITKLFADPKIIEMQKERLKSLLSKETSDEEIKKRVHSMVVKENAFNSIMEYLSKLFEYDLNPEELKKVFEKIVKQFNLDPIKDEERIKAISERIIIKSLIFKEVAKEKNINISDDEAKKYLEKYYKETNQPINDLLNSSEKFSEVKEIILEEKITEILLTTFKVKFELEK